MSLPGRFHGIGPARYLGWWVMRGLLQPVVWWVWRIRVTGLENIPARGPFLLLPNHTSLFDPIWVAARLPRPSHFMAAELLFRTRIGGAIIRFFGAFPKKKQVSDRQSMEELQRLYDAGQIVTIFVEGQRTWDGRMQPVGDGVGRMIKRMGARVVICRVSTGHLQQPRWSTRMRWMPVRIHYEGPVEYGPQATVEEITADVLRRMEIEPHPELHGFTWGRNLARGLPFFLWACPACGALDGLGAQGDRVRCRRCEATWRIDLRNRLHGEDGAPDMLLTEASDAIRARLGMPPVADRAALAEGGVVLEGGPVQVSRIERGPVPPELLAEGRLVLRERVLEVRSEGGEVALSLELEDIEAVTTELGGLVQVRLADRLLRLSVVSAESSLKWHHFLEAWVDRAQDRGEAPE